MANGANRHQGHQQQNRGPRNTSGQERGQSNQDLPDVAKAVIEGFNKEFLDKVEPFAQKLAATNSQVRNIFSMVDRLRNKPFDEEEFLMLRPRLAYAATRERSLQSLKDVLSKGVDAVVNAGNDDMKKERFERFCKCCEAILAYAKKRERKP